jgi:Protein of unknown function (DUF2726)
VSWRAGAQPFVGESLLEDPWPVTAKKLLTERELSLYQSLLNLYPDHKLFIQVALSQLIDVDRNHPERESIRARYKQLVADFVLCRADLSVVAVIELDDRSHEAPIRQAADGRKNKVLADAGIRLVRIPAGRLPSPGDLRALIDAERKPADGPPESIELTLAEDIYPGEGPYDSEDESSAVSRELKRVALKALFVAVLVLCGWLFFGYLLPAAVKQAFQPLAIPQVRVAQVPAASVAQRPIPVARPLARTAPVISGPGAAELAERKRAILQEAAAQQRQEDLAWAAFYSAPASCEHPVDWKAQVECGNQYMRAKKVFEQKWAADHP